MAERPGGLPAGSELIAGAAEVDAAIRRWAERIRPAIGSDECLLLAVMLGGMIPAVRLAAELDRDLLLDYCHLSRYHGREAGAEPVWLREPPDSVCGRQVLIVDDIFDRGITLSLVRDACHAAGASRVLSATLVRKRIAADPDIQPPDFWALEVPDRYVFGCGMDYRHHWRHLPAIYALAASDECASG